MLTDRICDLASLPWFAAQLKPNGLARARENLKRQAFPVFAPEIKATALKLGKRVNIRKPLFPGYIFVSFNPEGKSWTAINSTRGVLRLVSPDSRRPAALPGELMAGLMARCNADGLLLPPSGLEAGDRIRILAGPFADYVCRIESINDSERVSVLIELMERKVSASLPRTDIQKLT